VRTTAKDEVVEIVLTMMLNSGCKSDVLGYFESNDSEIRNKLFLKWIELTQSNSILFFK
tara:strand:- start:173 stop:349 length:177 start_codon:yes stop_codon:yes gene_type:complete